MSIESEIQQRLTEAHESGRLAMISIATKISVDDLQKMMNGDIPLQADAFTSLFKLG